MSASGAERLAARIERYWRKQGYEEQAHIVHEGELSGRPYLACAAIWSGGCRMSKALQKRWGRERAGRQSKRRHALYGKLGAASACRRIDPKSGEVIEVLAAKYDRRTRDKRARG
jgi:hypothetical protein